MKVKAHALFERLIQATEARPEAVLGFSLATPPTLGDYLEDLDPGLSLDWSNESFQGRLALREHIVARANLSDVCSPADVVITAGAAEANFLAFTQLVQPGDEVVLESPGWPQPFVLAEAIGATVRVLPRRADHGWDLDLDALERVVSDRTRLIFVSNPNNPTGRVLTPAEQARIVDAASRVGAHLVSDEVYAGLEWTGSRVPSAAALYERGITTGSVSKVLGLQGLRIGWLVCRDPGVVRDTVVLRENTSEIMNVVGEAIAEVALRADRFAASIARARAEGEASLAILDRVIASRPELSWVRPEAGLIGLCRVDAPIGAEALADRLLAPPYRTFVIPGTAYGCPDHLRLGVGGGPAVELEKGLGRLAALLDASRVGPG